MRRPILLAALAGAILVPMTITTPTALATPTCTKHELNTPMPDSGNLDGRWDFKCGDAPWEIFVYPLVESGGSWVQAFCNNVTGDCQHDWGPFAGNTEHWHVDGWDTELQVCSHRWKTHVEVYNTNTGNLFAQYSSPILGQTC